MRNKYITPTIDETVIVEQLMLESSLGIDVSDNEHDEDAGQLSKSRFSFGEYKDDDSESDSFSF